MSSGSAFTGKKLELLQTLLPEYEAAKAAKQYKDFWPTLFSTFSTQFPLVEELFPGRALGDLSTDETAQHAVALTKRKAKLKEWYRWKTNPRSRNSNNTITGKDLKRIYGAKNTRDAKAYEVFAELFPDVIKPVYEQSCIDQGATGRAKLPVWHSVVSGLWTNATEDQRAAVNARLGKATSESSDVIEKIVESPGDATPQMYQRFQTVLPSIIQATLEPAVRKAGMMAVVTLVGPVPKLGGRIQTTSLQFGDNQETPLFSEEWAGHDQHFIEALASFARKHLFPEELCTSRSLQADPDAGGDGEEVEDERSGTNPEEASKNSSTEQGEKLPGKEAQKENEPAAETLGQDPHKLDTSQGDYPKDDTIPAITPPSNRLPQTPSATQGCTVLLQPPANPFSFNPGTPPTTENASLPTAGTGFAFGRPVPNSSSTEFGMTTPQPNVFPLAMPLPSFSKAPSAPFTFTQPPHQVLDPNTSIRHEEYSGVSLHLRTPSPNATTDVWAPYSMSDLLNNQTPWDDLDTMGRIGTEDDITNLEESAKWDLSFASSIKYLQPVLNQTPDPLHDTEGTPSPYMDAPTGNAPQNPINHRVPPVIGEHDGATTGLAPIHPSVVGDTTPLQLMPASATLAAPLLSAHAALNAPPSQHGSLFGLNTVSLPCQLPSVPSVTLLATPPPPQLIAVTSPPLQLVRSNHLSENSAPSPHPHGAPPTNLPSALPPKPQETNPSPPRLPPAQISPTNASTSPPPVPEPPKKPLSSSTINTDSVQSVARRSARGPVPSKRTENLNLIGTNALMHTHTVSPPQEDTGPPDWFVAASEYLKSDGSLGAEWMSMVDLWVRLEGEMGYGRISKGALPVQHRPDEWKHWTSKSNRGGRGGRAYNDPPFILEPAEFGLAFTKWWSTVQPAFRQSDTPFPKQVWIDSSGHGDPWAPIRKSGPNGLVSVVTMMKWWGTEAMKASQFKIDSRAEWKYLVSDISFSMEEMFRSIWHRLHRLQAKEGRS